VDLYIIISNSREKGFGSFRIFSPGLEKKGEQVLSVHLDEGSLSAAPMHSVTSCHLLQLNFIGSQSMESNEVYFVCSRKCTISDV